MAAAFTAWRYLPRVDPPSCPPLGVLRTLREVLAEPNHWRVLILVGLVGAAGFTTIPFLALYLTTNAVVDLTQVPLVYFAGGLAGIVVGRVAGAWTDRWGSVPTFRLVVLSSVIPLIAATHLNPLPLWAVLVVTTMFFALMSSRMVPGSVIVAAAGAAHVRGAFIGLKVAVHTGSMAVGSLAGAAVISRDPGGLVTGYGACGWVAAMLSVAAVWWVGRVEITHQARSQGMTATPSNRASAA